MEIEYPEFILGWFGGALFVFLVSHNFTALSGSLIVGLLLWLLLEFRLVKKAFGK